MKHIGYCPHCGAKLVEASVLGMYDDFTIVCFGCKRKVPIYLLKWKNVGEISTVINKLSTVIE
jgi:hypothetical protein